MSAPKKIAPAATASAALLILGYIAVLGAGYWATPAMPVIAAPLAATVPGARIDQPEETSSPTP